MNVARSVTTDVGGTHVHSVEDGPADAPVLLLVHGLGASVTRWIDVVPLFAERFRTIAIDLPGFGRSAVPQGRYSTAWLAGAIRAFLDARGVERAAVVGNSLGGTVGMRFASRWPGRCDALVLVGAALPGTERSRFKPRALTQYVLPVVPLLGELMYSSYMRLPAERRLRDSLSNVFADPSRVRQATREVLLEEFAERPGRADLQRSLLAAQRSIMSELFFRRRELEGIAGSLRVPTLVLWGAYDRVVPVSTGRAFASRIPGARLVVFDDAGHTPQLEHPERFAQTVTDFLAEAERRS